MKVAVLASGGGTNLQALIDDAGDSYRIAVVASDRSQAGALRRAEREGVATLHVRDPCDGSGLADKLARHGPDLIVLAGYLKLVPRELLARFPGRIINVHPALLPAFGGKGMYGRRVHQAVIDAGVNITGATVHLVDEEYDRGVVLAQWPVPVSKDDTAETLQQRVLAVEHRLLPAVVRVAAAAGQVVPLRPMARAFAGAEAPKLQFETQQ